SFFFQAEDGIRDFHVTGVQTCALPILNFGSLVCHQTHSSPVSSNILKVDPSSETGATVFNQCLAESSVECRQTNQRLSYLSTSKIKNSRFIFMALWWFVEFKEFPELFWRESFEFLFEDEHLVA